MTPLTKNKEVQSVTVVSRESSAQVSESDIADSFRMASYAAFPGTQTQMHQANRLPKELGQPEDIVATDAGDDGTVADRANGEVLKDLDVDPGAWVDVDTADWPPMPQLPGPKRKCGDWRNSGADHQALRLLERATVQNSEHSRLLSYRKAVQPPEIGVSAIPALEVPVATTPVRRAHPASTVATTAPAEVQKPLLLEELWNFDFWHAGKAEHQLHHVESQRFRQAGCGIRLV